MNPFNPSYGDIPQIRLSGLNTPQDTVNEMIINSDFTQSILITGIRGTGKTAYLAQCGQILNEQSNYVVIDDVENNRFLLNQILLQLQRQLPKTHRIKMNSLKTKIGDFTWESSINEMATPTVLDLIKQAVYELNNLNKIPVILIDEISVTQPVKDLIQIFATLKRRRAKMFLILAGLPELIDELQSQPNLTFLKRAAKVFLKPFNDKLVANEYQRVFNCDRFVANQLAQYVQGYAYAFQLLGYVLYKQCQAGDTDLLEIAKEYLPEYKEILYENSYSEIINELSPVEREYVKQIIVNNGEFGKIQKAMRVGKGYVSRYRGILLKQHLIKSVDWGIVDFTLPFFAECTKAWL